MTLGDLIKELEKHDPEKIVLVGFNNPDSYRGYYDELAFEPAKNIKIKDMLLAAKSAVGKTYYGYKGGEYIMNEYTEVHLAEYGCTGEGIGPTLLNFMLKE